MGVDMGPDDGPGIVDAVHQIDIAGEVWPANTPEVVLFCQNGDNLVGRQRRMPVGDRER